MGLRRDLGPGPCAVTDHFHETQGEPPEGLCYGHGEISNALVFF